MKVLLVTLEYPPFQGGVANYYYNLVKHWPCQSSIFVLDNSKNELLYKKIIFPWLKALISIFQKIKTNNFDYLLVGQILPLGTVAMILSFLMPLKYGIIIHGLDFTQALMSRRKRFLVKCILKRAHKIICANSYVLSLVNDFYPLINSKLYKINPGITLEAPNTNQSRLLGIVENYKLENNFILFSIGRLVARKGFDKTIEAVSKICIEHNIKYFIAGEGPDRAYLESLVIKYKVQNNIFFLNALSENDKWSWMNIMDVFIMPARRIGPDFEGFGIVYLEANLCAKPVIAGLAGGVGDAVEDGVNGFLVNPESTQEIVSSILKLKNDQNLTKAMGDSGRQKVKDFAWEKQAKLFAAIIT